MVVAGLTGGIASGKSTVSALLAGFGAQVIDADRLAHAAVAPGAPAFEGVLAHFGRGILAPDGAIDRRRLADIVFGDPAERKRLEAIVHPRVKEATDRRLAEISRSLPQAVVILDVPLLFESGMDAGLAEVIVVWVPEAVQVARLIARDRLTAEAALSRIRAQMPLERKKALATALIDNTGPLADTRHQARQVYDALAARARQNA
jgi:dephospho-CoA kinase